MVHTETCLLPLLWAQLGRSESLHYVGQMLIRPQVSKRVLGTTHRTAAVPSQAGICLLVVSDASLAETVTTA